MIKNTKIRKMITLSKKQNDWLDKFCKDHDITPSKYISYLLVHKAEEMIQVLKIDNTKYTEEEIQEILSVPWIED